MGTSSNKFKLDVCAKVSNPLGWDGDYIATVAYTAIDMVSNPLGWDGDDDEGSGVPPFRLRF